MRGRGRFLITARVLPLPRAARAVCRPGVCSPSSAANREARFTAAAGAAAALRTAVTVAARRWVPSTAAGATTRYPATAALAADLQKTVWGFFCFFMFLTYQEYTHISNLAASEQKSGTNLKYLPLHKNNERYTKLILTRMLAPVSRLWLASRS